MKNNNDSFKSLFSMLIGANENIETPIKLAAVNPNSLLSTHIVH